ISLAFGSLTYVYIINIIEPRLADKREAGSNINWFLANLELVLVLAAILLGIVALLFGVENMLYLYSNSFFSFAMFIVCVLLSSFTLGYGIYFSGLVETANFLEKEMELLSIKAAYNSFPNIRAIINAD